MVEPNVRATLEDAPADSALTDARAGVSSLGGTGTKIAMVAAAIRGSRGLRISGDGVSSWFNQLISGGQSIAGGQQYFRVGSTPPASTLTFMQVRNSSGAGASASILSNGNLIVQDAQPTTRLTVPAASLPPGDYVLSISCVKGTTSTNGRLGIWLRKATDHSLVVSAVDISNANTGMADYTEVRHGKTGGGGTITYDMDEAAAAWGTFGEIALVSSIAKIANVVASRVTSSSAKIEWTHPNDAPDGVSIIRCLGAKVNDGNNKTPSDPAYDPMTLTGAVEIETGLDEPPFIDSGLASGQTYTYWVVRS